MRYILFLLIIGLTSTVAHAQKQPLAVDIGGKKVILLTAPGQCQLDSKHPADKTNIKATKKALAGHNELLHIAADCDQLAEWRKGKRPNLGEFTQTQISIKLKKFDVAGRERAFVTNTCNEIRKQGSSTAEEIELEVKNRIEDAVKGAKVHALQFLGVIDEDVNACYAGILQNLTTQTGKNISLLCIYATTVIKGRILFLYRYAEVDNKTAATTSDRLLKAQKAHVIAHIRANK